jgi:hypothetical protein
LEVQEMKMVKSLLLGTAAGLVAMSGAQAADLPVKAKPVQYVKICSLYGAGFYYIPGTDTCIKIGGFVRTEMNFNAGGSFSFLNGNLDNPHRVDTTWRSRAVVTFDVRSQTEYGTLRSYMAGGYQWDNGAGSGVQSGPVANGAAAGVVSGTLNTSLNIYRGFIQWAGFTAGRSKSFFDVFDTPVYSNTTNVWTSDTGGTGINLLGYTAQFGNGFSATIAAEDGNHRRACGGGAISNCNTGIAGTATGMYAGVSFPDVVANLRIDQAWGSAQVMGAVHYIEAVLGGGGAPTNTSIDEIGWAVGAGLHLNLPMLGARDTFTTQVTYAEGAMHYVGSGLGAGNTAKTLSAGGGGTLGIAERANGPVFDAVFTGGSLDLTTGWSLGAGIQHYWTPTLRTSLYGFYGEIEYSAAATAPGVRGDWSMWQIGSRTVWNPVTNLDLSVDILYNSIDGVTGAGGIADNTVSSLQGMVRAQRNFYP